MAGMIFGEPGLLYWLYRRNRPCRLPVGLVSCLPGWPSLLASVFRGGPLPCELSGIATGTSLPRQTWRSQNTQGTETPASFENTLKVAV